jgi:fatty acid desaturase
MSTSDMESKQDKPANCGEIENQHNSILAIRKIFREEIKTYSKLRPWIGFLSIATQWAIIATTIAAAIHFSHWLIWIIAVIVISSRQHALMVLGHEAAHHRLHKNKAINDFVGEVFCLLPIFLCLKPWQQEHLAHHRNVNTAQDPYWNDFNKYKEWHWPKNKKGALKVLLRDITGRSSRDNFEVSKRWSAFGQTTVILSRYEKARVILFNTALLASLVITGGWWLFIFLWVLPLLTVTALLVRIRGVAEHLGMPGLGSSSGIDATRHVDASLLERLTVCPLSINYHIDHHIFPSIPYYNLKKFHQRLLANDHYRQHGQFYQGYLSKKGVLGEVLAE